MPDSSSIMLYRFYKQIIKQPIKDDSLEMPCIKLSAINLFKDIYYLLVVHKSDTNKTAIY